MTEKELKQTLALAREGDEPAREKVVNEYKNLVRSLTRRYILPDGEWEDLVQEGMIGVFSAINSYDETAGLSFKNFLCLCVKRRIYDALKKYKGNNTLQLVSLFESEDAFVADPEEEVLRGEEQKELLKRLGRVLSDFEYRVFTLYLEGFSVFEICETVGKDAKCVDNAVQRSKKKLKNEYYGEK